MQIKLDNNTKYIITTLENMGFSAYAVGGALRDMLLGREVTDYDITTSALPEQTKEAFKNFRVAETGIAHGTVTVIIDNKPYEVTTFRTESYYSDSRHPDSVSFVNDVKSDLARRDFTMNAIAFSPKNGIVDPFFGIEDINKRLIRTVGSAKTRFSEDALRILRALRFSSVLGFEIDEEASKAIFELSGSLEKIASERIYAELKKLLCGDNAENVISSYRTVLEKIVPIKDDISSLSKLPKDYKMRFAYLCENSVEDALNTLKADNETKRICEILAESNKLPSSNIELKHYISYFGRENSRMVAAYRRSLFDEDIDMKTEQILDCGCPLFINELDINGDDLKTIGIEGKLIGETLSKLLCMVIEEKAVNEKNALLEQAKRLCI